MSGRLAAYRAGQPPRTANRAAMPDNVSPGCTTYLAAGPAARPGAAATLSVLARVTSSSTTRDADVRLGRAGGSLHAGRHQDDPECSRRARRTRTSSTHAQCCHFPSEGISAGRCWPGRRKARTSQEGKDLSGRHLRQVGAPDRLRGGTTRQPQQHQREQRDQSSTDATLHSAARCSRRRHRQSRCRRLRRSRRGPAGSRGNAGVGAIGAPPPPAPADAGSEDRPAPSAAVEAAAADAPPA